MSGTVPPPPPGTDGRPPSLPPSVPSPAGGVRRVASAYQRPAAVDPRAEVPLQQVTAPAPATPPAGASTVHAPVPPPPDAGATAPQAPPQPAYQPAAQHTQQLPPAVPSAPPASAPPAYTAQPAYAPQPSYAPAPAAAATQVQQPVYAQQPAAQAGYTAPPAPPAPPRRRRRLSAGWIAFIAVDAVLIVTMVVLAVQMFGAPSPTAPQAGGAPVASQEPAPSASEEAPMQGEALAHFAAPSKNITCSIYADGASCGIAQLNQQPAPMEGCDGTTGYVVTVDGAGEVAQPCVPKGEQPTAATDDVDVLEYGDSITEGDFTCRSEDTGMSCTHDPTGNGFSLARAGIGTS